MYSSFCNANVIITTGDALVLAEPLAGNVEIVVSGDAALLKRASFERLKLVSPRQFWEALHARDR